MTLIKPEPRRFLQAARESAQAADAPSAIAVVESCRRSACFLADRRVRPASADIAIEKARTAARLQRPPRRSRTGINRGRTAFITAGIVALHGGVPIRVNGEVVGAVVLPASAGERHRDREHRGGGPEPYIDDSSA